MLLIRIVILLSLNYTTSFFESNIKKEPLEKKLYFAGEATINNYYGTCHGAYISGINAAKEIILKLKN